MTTKADRPTLTQDMVDAAFVQGYRMHGVYLYTRVPDECLFTHPADEQPRFFMRMQQNNLPHYLTHDDMRHMQKVQRHAKAYSIGTSKMEARK